MTFEPFEPYEHGPGELADAVPTPDEIASLLQVEHLLDQRWPETKIEPSLTRISAVIDLLGSPQLAYPSIHIAGTNGKTSVARMVDALVTALQQRTGRTTSPHLQSAVERIAIDGKPISPAQYVATYREIEPFVQMVDAQSQADGGPAMSKFEVLTAMAFAAFADAPVDVAVIEVGLGGRWDATNVINAPVAVITPISVDHVEYLGCRHRRDRRGEGGHHSSGRRTGRRTPSRSSRVRCRRRWRWCWRRRCVPTPRSRARIPSSRCWAAKSRSVGSCCNCRASAGCTPTSICLCTANTRRTTRSLALAAVEAFFGAGAQRQLDVDAVRAGFAAVISPGRLERMRSAPTVFIDAAHNPAGAAALARTLADEFDFRALVGVISVMADKDVDGILAALEPVFDSVVVTHNGSPRALDVESLALAAGQRFGPDRVITAENLRDAIDAATALVDDAAGNAPDLDAFGEARCFPAPGSSSPVRSSRPGPPAPCSGVIPNEPGPAPGPAQPPADPWKSFSGVMAATLMLEAIVVLLAIPVVGAVGGGLTAASLGYLIGLAVLLILLAGLQRRPWAIWMNLAVTAGAAGRLRAVLGRGIDRFAVYRGVGADRLPALRGPAPPARALATGLELVLYAVRRDRTDPGIDQAGRRRATADRRDHQPHRAKRPHHRGAGA